MKATKFTGSGGKLEASLFYPAELTPGNPAVLFVHGWTSKKENYYGRAEALSRLGYIALAFDLSGQGASPGRLEDFSRKDHLADVLAAFDFLVAHKNVDSERIGICGISYGAYLAAIAIGYRHIPWLAMRVPALYPDDNFMAPTHDLITKNPDIFKAWRGQTAANNLALKTLCTYEGDVLLVQSGADELIPEQTITAYIDAAGNSRLTHRVMEGADHSIFTEQWEAEFIGILTGWFREQTHP